MSESTDVRLRIEAILADHPVVLFMKGTREAPSCGFSAATVGALNDLLENYHTVNVLADEEIRNGIKEYANWPTIPQLYIKGEFVGGCDIMKEMYQTGELQQMLEGIAQA